jgi:hypothetical protein
LVLPAEQHPLARTRQLPLLLLQVLQLPQQKLARPVLLQQLQRVPSLLLLVRLVLVLRLRLQQAANARQLQAASQARSQPPARVHNLYLRLPAALNPQQQQVQGGQDQGPRQGVQVQVALASQQARPQGALLVNPPRGSAWGQLCGPWLLWG